MCVRFYCGNLVEWVESDFYWWLSAVRYVHAGSISHWPSRSRLFFLHPSIRPPTLAPLFPHHTSDSSNCCNTDRNQSCRCPTDAPGAGTSSCTPFGTCGATAAVGSLGASPVSHTAVIVQARMLLCSLKGSNGIGVTTSLIEYF